MRALPAGPGGAWQGVPSATPKGAAPKLRHNLRHRPQDLAVTLVQLLRLLRVAHVAVLTPVAVGATSCTRRWQHGNDSLRHGDETLWDKVSGGRGDMGLLAAAAYHWLSAAGCLLHTAHYSLPSSGPVQLANSATAGRRTARLRLSAGSRPHSHAHVPLAAAQPLQAARRWPPAAGRLLPTACYRPWSPNTRRLRAVAYSWPPNPGNVLLPAHLRLAAAQHWPPTAGNPPLAAYHLCVGGSGLPAAHNRHP